MWKASRCAVRCPMPGSFESSPTSFSIGSGYTRAATSPAAGRRDLRPRRLRAESGDAAHLRGGEPWAARIASLTAARTMS